MYNKVPPAVDSVGVNSYEKFGILIFFTMLVFFSNLVSEIAIMSKLVLVVLSKYSRSSKVLDKEHVLIWNKEREPFLLEIFMVRTSLLDCNICTQLHFQGL